MHLINGEDGRLENVLTTEMWRDNSLNRRLVRFLYVGWKRRVRTIWQNNMFFDIFPFLFLSISVEELESLNTTTKRLRRPKDDNRELIIAFVNWFKSHLNNNLYNSLIPLDWRRCWYAACMGSYRIELLVFVYVWKNKIGFYKT